MSSSSDICSPEQRQGVHKLAQHGGEAGQLGEHGCLDGQPLLRAPEAAGLPVSEGPWDAQLPHQRKDIVILRAPDQVSIVGARCLMGSAGCFISGWGSLLYATVCEFRLWLCADHQADPCLVPEALDACLHCLPS